MPMPKGAANALAGWFRKYGSCTSENAIANNGNEAGNQFDLAMMAFVASLGSRHELRSSGHTSRGCRVHP